MRPSILAAFALALLSTPPLLAANSGPEVGRITMTGTGEALAAPDMATLSIGVVSQGKTARDALAANSKAMSDAAEALKASGVAPRDLQTSNFSVRPIYANEAARNAPTPRSIIGYEVQNTLGIRLRDLAKLGDILDKAVSLGANAISGPSFGLSEPESQRVEARKLALADATRRAKLYADGLGIKLGRVVSVSEDTQTYAQPRFRAAPMSVAGATPPIEAGETSISRTSR